MLQYQHMFCTIGSGGCTRNICISSFILPSRLMLSTLAFSQFSLLLCGMLHRYCFPCLDCKVWLCELCQLGGSGSSFRTPSTSELCQLGPLLQIRAPMSNYSVSISWCTLCAHDSEFGTFFWFLTYSYAEFRFLTILTYLILRPISILTHSYASFDS